MPIDHSMTDSGQRQAPATYHLLRRISKIIKTACTMECFTHHWFSLDQSDKNALDVHLLINGNIYNNNLPMQYVPSISAYALSPLPPSTYLATSYQNAYQTAFEAEGNAALNNYQHIYLQNGFIDGTFGYVEEYPNVPPIKYLIEDIRNYQDQPYLFVSAGSGGGSGYMYLNWIIATFGVPYELTVPS